MYLFFKNKYKYIIIYIISNKQLCQKNIKNMKLI